MQLSYNYQDLFIPEPALELWVKQNIDLNGLSRLTITERNWPSVEIIGISFPLSTIPRPRIRLNTLYYPHMMSNYAEGFFLLDQTGYNNLLQNVLVSGSSLKQFPFIMDDGIGSIQTNLCCLPPRPLGKVPGKDGCYLLHLVDDRYFYQTLGTTVINITGGTTTWNNLYTTLAANLFITFTADAIPAVYGYPSPDSAMNTSYANAVQLIDAVAMNVGQRIIRNFNGTYRACNFSVCNSEVNNNINAFADNRLAGGDCIGDNS
jgi:hypothetical protein